MYVSGYGPELTTPVLRYYRMMSSVLMSVFAGLFGSALLYLVFRLLENDWPNNYADMKNVVDSASQRNMWVYLAMRFVPMYIASVLVASLAEAIGGRAALALVTCAVLHLCLTNFRPHILRRTFKFSRVRVRYVAVFLETVVAIVLATFLAGISWSYLLPFLPDVDELVQAIWTSVFVALAVISLRSFGTFEQNLDKQIERAQEELGEEVLYVIQREARQNDVSADFIEAVVLTECIQRPAWIRRIEYFKGRFSGPGTYGVAQVYSSEPISDELSIKLLCQNYAGYYPEGHEDHGYNRTLFRVELETINSSPVFVEQVMDIYERLSPYPRDSSEYFARDNKKFIEILSLKRDGKEWVLQVSLGPGWGQVEVTTVDRDLVEKSSTIFGGSESTVRRFEKLVVPVGILFAELRTNEPTSSQSQPDSVLIDLEDPWMYD